GGDQRLREGGRPRPGRRAVSGGPGGIAKADQVVGADRRKSNSQVTLPNNGAADGTMTVPSRPRDDGVERFDRAASVTADATRSPSPPMRNRPVLLASPYSALPLRVGAAMEWHRGGVGP